MLHKIKYGNVSDVTTFKEIGSFFHLVLLLAKCGNLARQKDGFRVSLRSQGVNHTFMSLRARRGNLLRKIKICIYEISFFI